MARKLLTAVATSILATCATSTALADDVVAPLGLHLGGAIGRANVRVDSRTTGDLFDLDAHDLGWKAMIGAIWTF